MKATPLEVSFLDDRISTESDVEFDARNTVYRKRHVAMEFNCAHNSPATRVPLARIQHTIHTVSIL